MIIKLEDIQEGTDIGPIVRGIMGILKPVPGSHTLRLPAGNFVMSAPPDTHSLSERKFWGGKAEDIIVGEGFTDTVVTPTGLRASKEPENVETLTNYTHHYQGDELVGCSDETVIYDENGIDTGFRYCPHLDQTFDTPENVDCPTCGGSRVTSDGCDEYEAVTCLTCVSENVEEPVCNCPRFSDTEGFRIADLTCPIHGVRGTDPGDGPWE